MKKMMILGVIASLLVLAGCANHQGCSTGQASAAPSHHDYKGESFK